MKDALALLLACVAAVAGFAAEPTAHEVASPDGRLHFVFSLTASGEPTYVVTGSRGPLILPSKLGLAANPAGDHTPDWLNGLRIAHTRRGQNDTSWRPVAGERAEIPDRYNALTVELRHVARDHGPLQIQVRAYDEGIAFRYYFPEDEKTRVVDIGAERTEFNLPTGAQAYWTPAAQKFYEKIPVRDWASDCEVPLTIALPDGRWLCLTEAAQTNYSRMRLKAVGANRLMTRLFGEVTETSPFGTPWRVVMAADRPGALLENNYLILNLNPPCEIADTSWIHPGRVMREGSLSTDGMKRLVDFAVEQNIDYVHLDAGWYGHEFEIAPDATRVDVDPRRNPKGDLDLPEAIRYAKSKGRRVMLYVNHRALGKQMEVLFPLYEKWGVSGVKFGFVHTGSQRWTVWLHEAIKLAARHRLVVDVHDDYRPTGFSRTYPNLLQQEGIAGDEESPTATQNTIYPFTRFIAGAADHTYCFHSKKLKNTKAHQLALAAVNFGPLQFLHWYDSPAKYTNRAEIEFWKDLPTVWEETHVVGGSPGEFIVTARRQGADWWIGGITNVDARTLAVPLTFLPAGAAFAADIYEDDGHESIAKRTQSVTRETSLSLGVRPSGGVAIRLRAARP